MADFRTSPNSQADSFSEKKEFLRREEIKTMEKEIGKIREETAEKEREKIKNFEAPQKIKREIPPAPELKQNEPVAPNFPQEQPKPQIFPQPKSAPTSNQSFRPAARALYDRKEPVFGQRETIAAAPLSPNTNAPNSARQVDDQIKSLGDKKQILDSKKKQLTQELEKLQVTLVGAKQNEQNIENNKKIIEEKEAGVVTPQEKRKIEEERWAIEQMRQVAEKERWGIEKDIESCQNELAKNNADYQQILNQEKDVQKQKNDISKTEERIKMNEEKISLEKEVIDFAEKDKFKISEKNDLISKQNLIKNDLEKVKTAENDIELKIKQAEEREALAPNPQEKRKIEEGRWQLEQQRAELEKNRWAKESENDQIEILLKKAETDLEASKIRQSDIRMRLQQIDPQINETPKPIETKPNLEEILSQNQKKEEPTKPASQPFRPTQVWQRPDVAAKEAVPGPKREEIARRIFLEKTQGSEKKTTVPLPQPAQKDYQPETQALQPLHKKQSVLTKLWVRFVLFFLTAAMLFVVATFWYWYFQNK